MKDRLILKGTFGADQQLGIDRLIEEMTKAGEILAVKRSRRKDQVHYEIEFASTWSIYLFGWRQANLAKYLLG